MTSGAWDPRPAELSEIEDLVTLRQGGMKALLDRMKIATGERFDREVRPWMVPSGQRLRLQGLGHVGRCNASALTVPTAREFLDRWVER